MRTDQQRQDAELKQILTANDPAGSVSHDDSARMQMFIMDRVFYQPQPQYVSPSGGLLDGRLADFFAMPAFLRGAFSWPVTLTGTMMVGLLLGFFVSSLADTATPAVASYNVAMIGPWQQLMR